MENNNATDSVLGSLADPDSTESRLLASLFCYFPVDGSDYDPFDACRRELSPDDFKPRDRVIAAQIYSRLLRLDLTPGDSVAAAFMRRHCNETWYTDNNIQSVINRLAGADIPTSHTTRDARAIHRDAHRRKVLDALSLAFRRLEHSPNEDGSLLTVCLDLESDIFKLNEQILPTRPELVRDAVISHAANDIRDIIRNGASAITGVLTSFTPLDRLLQGLNPEEMIVIAARPSVGKTALAMNIAMNAACNGHRTLVISREMGARELVRRIFLTRAGINLGDYRDLTVHCDRKETDLANLEKAEAELRSIPLDIDDNNDNEIDGIRAAVRRHKRRHHDLGLVIIDYLQYLNSQQYARQSRPFEVAAISKEVKAMARELGVPVVILSQISREGQDKPTLATLKDSGAIEQDADKVILLHRESEKTDIQLINVDVAKNRNGECGEFKLAFEAPYTRFTDDPEKIESALASSQSATSGTQPKKLDW